ncbi:MAG: T9SS type A sorting domain-containing protein [Saprospiraceae bacterium]
MAWSTTGTGVYTMQSTSTVTLDTPLNPCTPIGGSNGTDDNKDVAAVADAGLLATDEIGGFTFTVYLEDIAPSTAPGANTLTATSFTSTVNGFEISAALPVELTSFDAKKSDEEVILNWNTASEINNDYFEIEHSNDGTDFTRIGNMEGKGQSNLSNDYRFIDAQPNNGLNYYRLKQVDFDGKYEYSDIVFVDFKMEDKVKIFPTLSTSEINVVLPESGRDINYEILNFTGQIIQEGTFDNNTITSKINIQNFPVGNYIIRIGNKSFSEILRFNKIQ